MGETDLISRQAAIKILRESEEYDADIPNRADGVRDAIIDIMSLPTIDAVQVVRCKDCVHQEKFFHEDKRRKDGGYYIYGCELADGYSHVCLDDDFCSRGERRTDETY